MNSENESFVEYFSLAQSNTLSRRESEIVELRYGLTSGEPNTLDFIGKKIGVTRERIRQILNLSLRKIVSKGRRGIKSGKVTESCAELLLYLSTTIRPEEEGAVDRLVDFAENNLSHLPKKCSLYLIAYLAFQSKKNAETVLVKARQIYLQRKAAKWKDYKKKALAEKFQELLVYAKWHSSITTSTVLSFESFNRKRDVSFNGKGNAGEFHSNKMNRLVQYESELEQDFFQWVEQLDEIVFYQEQPFEISYIYDGKKCVYYPDILLLLKDGKGIVVEIKPIFGMALHINLVKWAALKKFCADKGFGYLITDGRYAIQQIQHLEVNPTYSKAVLESLQAGALSWLQYKKIRDEYSPSQNDFVALVLKNKLIWRLSPFKLCISQK